MVTTVLPATAPTSVWHARCATPSMWIVQAPQRPAPQPYLVPVNPTWSRMAHSKRRSRVGIDRDLPIVQGERKPCFLLPVGLPSRPSPLAATIKEQ